MNLDEELSVLQILTALASRLRIILVCAVLGACITLGYALTRPVRYQSSVAFTTVMGTSAQTGLAALAGQLRNQATALTSETGPYTADLYMALMRSPVLLSRVVRDSVSDSESDGTRRQVTDVVNAQGNDQTTRLESAMAIVSKYTTIQRQRTTGLFELSVASPSPTLSVELIHAFLRVVESHNREIRRARVAEERAFLEQRMADAELELKGAEDRLQRFLSTNREISPASPAAFQRDQLNRTIELKQQIYKTLSTNYEDVRIREVRDAPYLSIVEPPRVARAPEPKKTTKWLLIGLVAGSLAGMVLAFMQLVGQRMAHERPEDVEALREALRGAMRRPKHSSQ